MSTYDIVHDIRYGIRYAHTISYITDIRYRMYLQTYDIVYVMDSLCSTISYVIHTTSHVDIRYRKNIRYRTYDIVCPTMQYRIYDIVHTIWYTTSNTWHTISYVQTYDIVGDIRYRMWQESRWSNRDPKALQARIIWAMHVSKTLFKSGALCKIRRCGIKDHVSESPGPA